MSAHGPTAPRTGSRASTVTLLVIAAVLAAAAAIAALALRGPAPPASLADRTRIVAQGLLCPACEGLSVADSPSAIAGEIRSDISRRLAAGQRPVAIRAYYVSRYGPRILLSPPKSGVTLVAWILPLLLVGLGIGLAIVALRRWTAGDAARRSERPRGGGSQPQPDEGDRLSRPDRALLDRARSGLSMSEDGE